jgi:hypothetical protein
MEADASKTDKRATEDAKRTAQFMPTKMSEGGGIEMRLER